MVIEASRERTLSIVLSAPTGRAHQYGVLAPLGASNQAGHLIIVKIRQADVEPHELGMKLLGKLERPPPE